MTIQKLKVNGNDAYAIGCTLSNAFGSPPALVIEEIDLPDIEAEKFINEPNKYEIKKIKGKHTVVNVKSTK